jgi:hypothetical protein
LLAFSHFAGISINERLRAKLTGTYVEQRPKQSVLYVGIYYDFKICRFVWRGLGANARLLPVRDERTGRNEWGSVRGDFLFDLTVRQRQTGAQPGKTLSQPFLTYYLCSFPFSFQ